MLHIGYSKNDEYMMNTWHELFSPLWTSVNGQRASRIALVAVAVLFTLTVLTELWSLRATGDTVDASVIVAVPHATAAQQVDNAAVGRLFGRAATHLPITQLQLQLTGIMQTGDGKASQAIIAQPDQPDQILHVGDSVGTTGVKLYAINQDNVVLENGGQLETLVLQRLSPTIVSAPTLINTPLPALKRLKIMRY